MVERPDKFVVLEKDGKITLFRNGEKVTHYCTVAQLAKELIESPVIHAGPAQR